MKETRRICFYLRPIGENGQEDSPVHRPRFLFNFEKPFNISCIEIKSPLVLGIKFFDISDEFQFVNNPLKSLR